MSEEKNQYSKEEVDEIVEILSTKASNPDEFFSFIEAKISNYNDLDELVGKALVILNNDKGINIIDIFRKINSSV